MSCLQATILPLARPDASTALPPAQPSRLRRAATCLRRASRPDVSVTALILVVALYLALAQNLALARVVAGSLPQPFGLQEWRIAASVFFTLFTLLLLVLAPFATRRVVKPAAIVLILLASTCGYFMDDLGVVIDRSMIASALRSDARETGDLLHGAFWGHVFLFGVLPSVALLRVRVRPETLRRGLGQRSLLLAAMLSVLALLAGLQFNEIVFWGRVHRDVRLWVNPIFPLHSLVAHLRDRSPVAPDRPVASIAPDATRALPAGHRRPFQVVFVVGETARARNFQLNGYARATNPRLGQITDLVNLGPAVTCGTSTIESVPCMFSRLGRQGFTRDRASAEENVLDVLARVGVQVSWWDNNTGCQGVCKRVETHGLENANDPELCPDGECLDAILLKDLERDLPREGEARLRVLHLNGSHGPAYYKRYPANARTFTPDCRDANVQRCTRDEIVNAYDNSLVYTDAFLAELIRRLDAHPELDSVVIYVSDHGESLGENGLFLHGFPYALAPEEQTRVPFIAWSSAGARDAMPTDAACLPGSADRSVSHDHVFHTLLGLFSVHTGAYREELDVFAKCRAVHARFLEDYVRSAGWRTAGAARGSAPVRVPRARGHHA
jgi:lipid A ethanolaminephosphotransferase